MSDTIKTPSESAVETRYLVMPGHANAFGTAFGGAIMSWVDMVAAMAAQKHCGLEVVTAGIDSVAFEEPVRIGDQVVLLACVNYVSKTSMEVGVKVIRENPCNGTRVTPPLTPQTDEEQRRWNNAALRVKARKELRQKTVR
ncbi:MAG: acyl-CoA thioesterase [Planctomycetota bacterium]|jgi:acyl-CoA hydrolase